MLYSKVIELTHAYILKPNYFKHLVFPLYRHYEHSAFVDRIFHGILHKSIQFTLTFYYKKKRNTLFNCDSTFMFQDVANPRILVSA